jgi:thioredoxin 1
MTYVENGSRDLEVDLNEVLSTKNRVFILFYASWCPHSRKFLPIYDRYLEERPQLFLRVKIDDQEGLMDRFSVEHVPTVIFFENGQIKKRCDGVAGIGIDEGRLIDLLGSCGI